MIITKFFPAFISFLVISLAGCSSQPVNVNTDYSEFDFGKLKTFEWVTDGPKRESKISNLVYERIENEITKNLTGKGFNISSDSDFFISYSVLKDAKVDFNQQKIYDYAPGFVWSSGFRHGYVLGTRVETVETNFERHIEGTLIIDILDAKTKKIIWRGIGSKRLPEVIDKKSRDDIVAETVTAVLKNFPPTK
mgnify:CR=1 FL=1